MDAREGSGHRTGAESARELLRRETADAHRALESLPGMRRLLEPSLEPAGYAAVLRGFLPVHGELEPRAAAIAGWEPGRSGARLQALARDLAQLDPGPPPQAPPPPRFDDAAAALGACYVLEGSFLGGAMIATQLRRHHGERLPLAYFAADGIAVGPRWQAFLERLEEALQGPRARARALHGAQRSYRWMARVLP